MLGFVDFVVSLVGLLWWVLFCLGDACWFEVVVGCIA